MASGTLYIVATPIGNLEDITLRALRILKETDIIAAEDTRHTLKLLSHFGISKPMVSYWGEREQAGAEQLIARLAEGKNVALVSDAGTPGISDPGQIIIRRAIAEGFRVVAVPGPSALIAALSLSGLPSDAFVFIGFLPTRQTQRKKKLSALVHETKTLIFYEAPHRILETLADLQEVLGERRSAVVRELTKIHEEAIRGSLSEVRRSLGSLATAGECVVVVEGLPEGRTVAADDVVNEVHGLMKKGLSRKEATRRIAEQYGISRKVLYDRSLEADVN